MLLLINYIVVALTNFVISLYFSLVYFQLSSLFSLPFVTDPTFVSSTFIPDEEKIYFFFSEVGREYDFIDKFIVSRVSQVCVVSVKQGLQ